MGNNLRHSMDAANTWYGAIFDLQGKLRTTANYNQSNTGKTGASSCKICCFYKCVHYITAEIILFPPL